MDIINSFNKHGFFKADIYHFLEKKKWGPTGQRTQITPSRYRLELGLSTAERLQQAGDLEVENLVSYGDTAHAALVFAPRAVVFQNYKPNDKYVAKFTVRNTSLSPVFLTMKFPDSSTFSIKLCGGQLLSRLAPGMGVSFNINFLPLQYVDYVHCVKFTTDTQEYVLPIIAIGARPMFDFPDQVNVPATPLKVQTHHTVSIHNIGCIPAGFTLKTQAPFTVHPKSAFLHPGERFDIKVGFKTMHLEESIGFLHAIFETGEVFCIRLASSAHTVKVELEKQKVLFSDTFNTLVRQQTFKITNKSPFTLTYACMKNSCVNADFNDKVKLVKLFYDVKENELGKDAKLVYYDILSSDEHLRVYTRIFYDEILALVADESLLFENMHFTIDPIKGQIWPNKTTELIITFAPKFYGDFEETVYFDLDGIYCRIPVVLTGASLPPDIVLNVETLDMDRVYIKKVYRYEVVAINRGHINGVILFQETPVLFGSKISCSPDMHCLRPGQKEIFVISFSNPNQGPYFEETRFVIRDTNITLKLYLKGEVIYPSLKFSTPFLDFGIVSIGVPKTLDLDVINESVISVNVCIKMPEDGPDVPSITLQDYAVMDWPKPETPTWPKEFTVEPSKINIPPESKVTLKVTLLANLVRANQTSMDIELEHSDSPPLVLPVRYDAQVPDITPAPDLHLDVCFLNYPYQHDVVFTATDVYGYFTVEEFQDQSELKVDVKLKEGIITRGEPTILPVEVVTSVEGNHEYILRIRLFGSSEVIDICRITACGVRPIVSCSPPSLAWGRVKLLTPDVQTLTLSNDSPITVHFAITLVGKLKSWLIEPSEGALLPESQRDVAVTALLLDAGKATNKLLVKFEQYSEIVVPLTATGYGTSIVIGEHRDKIILGLHFTHVKMNYKVVMENCGIKLHHLEWNENYKTSKKKESTTPFFDLNPRSMKLAAGEKVELSVTGVSRTAATVTDVWFLLGTVEGVNKKELLLECPVTAEFVDPKLELSTKLMEFRYDFGPFSQHYKITDILTIKNVSKLPLNIEIDIKPPFAVLKKRQTYVIPPEEANDCCCIKYLESDLDMGRLSKEKKDESKAIIDCLTENLVPPYNKESLKFFEDIHKIKMAFVFTNNIVETLDDQRVMKLQIVFDTTKHKTFNSKTYTDSVNIRFKGPKSKDVIKLVGKVNFPNIRFLEQQVDFKCIRNFSIESKTFQAENVTPLLVCYKFLWKTVEIADIEPPPSGPEDSTDTNEIESTDSDSAISASPLLPDEGQETEMENNSAVISIHNITKQEPNSPVTDSSSHQTEPIENRVLRKIIPMLGTDYCPVTEDWANKFPDKRKNNEVDVNDIVSIIPCRGSLEQNRKMTVNVVFNPPRNIVLKAVLECEVLGGPSETILITGQSSDMIYEINTHKLNYKIMSYHEKGLQKLIITNKALLPFEYRTYINTGTRNSNLTGFVADITPSEKRIEAYENMEIDVEVSPGVIGYFTDTFQLELGCCPPIPIEVVGWGEIPQVYLTSQKHDQATLSEGFTYLAIATLTPEYLCLVKEIFYRTEDNEHLNTPVSASPTIEDLPEHEDWYIVSDEDDYPSLMDIELVIEKQLVLEHLRQRPEILPMYLTGGRTGPIPGFRTMPCTVDFGVVIIGTVVSMSVDITNYGPTATKPGFSKIANIPPFVGFKLCGKLMPGDVGKMDVRFSPTRDKFVELEQNYEETFNLGVPYGVTIPVVVRATCAVPYLVSHVTAIDFGTVKCGDKVVHKIPLKNIGKPACVWYATLTVKSVGAAAITILDSSGVYDAGQEGWLSVAFRPSMEITYHGQLTLHFHLNPSPLTIPVRGAGVVPCVRVVGPSARFPPALPWAQPQHAYFGLMNPCNFPIELVFAHCDPKWSEEDKIYSLLMKYYGQPAELLLPRAAAGAALPAPLLHFYHTFTQRVDQLINEDSTPARKSSTTSKTKKSKSPRKMSAKTEKLPTEEISQRVSRTESEIISDVLKALRDENIDPLDECFQLLKPAPAEDEKPPSLKGILIFFHGSPDQDQYSQEMAYSIGKTLQIPTITFDRAFADALCTSESGAKSEALSIIDELYGNTSARQSSRPAANVGASTVDANNEVGRNSGPADEVETIMMKLEVIWKGKAVTPSKNRKKEGKGKAKNVSVATEDTMFPLNLIQRLLTDYFEQNKYSKGFIVDNLNSVVIRTPTLVLMTVLKCKRSISNIHLVLCHSEFPAWAARYEQSLAERDNKELSKPKLYNEEEIKEIIQSIEEMTEEEFENVSSEIKSIYYEHGLAERKRRSIAKTIIQIKKREGKNRPKTVPIKPTTHDVVTNVDKKKSKKDEQKSARQTTEYLLMSSKFNDYANNTFESLLSVASNWIVNECEMGTPMKKRSPSLKKAKLKTETEVHHDDTEIEKGFPLSIVMYPSILYKECLINMFKDSPEVQEALKEDPMHEIIHTEAKVENYTVLLPKTLPALQQEDALTWKFLKEPPIKRCECNQTINLKLFDDSTQDNVINCLSKWHCLCGKMVSAQTSTTAVRSVDKSVGESAEDDTGHPLPLYSVPSTTDIDHRLVLEPGDLVRCKFAFTPQTEGNFFLKRYVQVSGWPQSRVSVKASGLCDLPRIDSRPKKMFRDFVRRSVEAPEVLYKHTYLDDRKIFHFGPIFIGSKRVYEESYTIKLRNTSLLIDEIGIEFTEDTDVFKVDESLITIEAGMRAQVKISAAPTAAGEHRAVLLFCIRDNPEVVSVDVACTGVTPVIEVLPLSNVIDYGKLLLYRRKDDRFVIKNESMLPIMWKIRNPEELEENYTMSLKSGTVRRYDNAVVTVTYMASKVGVAKIPLVIDIYQSEGRGEPLMSRTISLSAECYDVQVQIAYEDDATHYLDYGNVKVNSTEVREVTLLNRGKYNIYFKLKKVSKFPEPMLLKSMRASPQTGVLLPSLKPTRIEFECTPKTKTNLHNVPAYTCLLLDGGKDQVIVAEFPICMTIASFYNTFSLYPLGELNFGVISMGTSVTREVILTNTSKCPFTYTLIVPEQNIVEADVPKSRTGTPKSPVSTKGKDNKIKNPPIKCGNFTISNDVNLLAPGASRALQVSFFAEEAQKYEETVQFIISDTCPAEADGVPLRLVGIGAIPSLDFWNLDNTFREQMILKDLSDYDNCETTPHCVFVEDSVTLHFLYVIVGSKYVATIDLYNNGLVPCALAMKLLYQSNSNAEIFSLDRNEAHIEPLTHKNLDIIFTPQALEEYRAVLEIRLKLNEKESQLYTLCIIGEGHIPRIQFTSPTMTAFKLGELSFPVTCLGSVTDAGVELENVSRVPCVVTLVLEEEGVDDRRVFWMTSCAVTEPAVLAENNDDVNYEYIIKLLPAETAKIIVHFNPLRKGKSNCEVKIYIADNPYENYTVVCSAEAFIEDVVLIGLEMLPPDLEPFDTDTTISAAEPSKKAERKEKKDKKTKKKKQKTRSLISTKTSDMVVGEPTLLKYLLDFGGCEVAVMHRRTVVMANNSDKLYKFTWRDAVFLLVKPSSGYISPGEEKDLEIVYLSPEPVILMKELLECILVAVNDEDLAMEIKDPAWDNQQCAVEFGHDGDLGIIERQAQITPEKEVFPIGAPLKALNIAILYSAITEYAKYKTNLEDKIQMADIFIYESKTFEFNVENIGDVPMRIAWRFHIDEHFPTRIDKNIISELTVNLAVVSETAVPVEEPEPESQDKPADESRVTLFSGSVDRESADTWFEADQPFSVAPNRACIPPQKLETFTVKFSPLEAFEYRVRLTSDIDNLDTQDQNLSSRIKARSLIPYIHLDVEESDYLTSGRRKGGKELPEHTTVLEFNVLGSGCYKKSLNVVNPTIEGYEYLIESVLSDESELVPMHSNKLKDYVHGGSSSEVTFTFVPTASGLYESLWKVYLPAKSIELDMLVVGIVREAKVTFVPCNLLIKNSMIGFTTSDTVVLRNPEMEELKFEFKGNSLLNESGKTAVVVQPPEGILKPCSDTAIRIVYTPTKDGPLTFKIHCKVTHVSRPLVLCVNALSYSIQPTVTYKMKDYQHTLNPDAITSIHFDQTASTYERTIPFTIKNEGSATFCYNWRYACSSVRKYLSVEVGPRNGHVAPAEEAECVLRFELKKVPVESFPVTLNITDGPIYNILLHAEIEKPKYRFSNINNMEHDFGKCIVNAPDDTYKKTFLIFNDDQKDLFLSCTFSNTPDLFVHIHSGRSLAPGDSGKVSVYFRPKAVQLYEFKLSFWLNTLCEEVVTINGEGVQLLFDLYEGCQKTFDLGPVKVGEKVVKELEVMNHSEVAIEAFLDFKSIYPTIEDDDVSSQGTSICLCPDKTGPIHESPVSRVDNLKRYNTKKVDEQMAKDNQRALSSLKVVPKRVLLKPHTKIPIKIYFKPVGLINNFDVQLHMAVLSTNKPLVRLQGSATDMCLCLSQESLQFGTVRKKGCKVMKLMLMNKGDFGTRFWWQPLITGEFTISPMHGNIEARANVTFTITYRPKMHNPFVKVWACCVIERYKQLEVAMFAACMDTGAVQTQTLYFHAPVRETVTEQVTVVNPSDEPWLVLSEMTGTSGCFETLKEFNIQPNSKYLIPITFKPRVMGVAEEQVLFAPLGDQSLMLKLVGVGEHPKPNEVIDFEVPAKDRYTLDLKVYNITEVPETYTVFSEVVKTVPDKFDGLYELKYPRVVRVWGDAAARCPWSLVCYGPCTMQIKVMFVNEDTKEYQYYTINATVTRSDILDTIHLVANARDTAQREISVTNPLSQDIDFRVSSPSLRVPDTITVPQGARASLLVKYAPLIVGETEELLEIQHPLVGSCVYRMMLSCLPGKVKRVATTCPLGASVPLRLRVQNRKDAKTEFTATTSDPCIVLDKKYVLSPLEKGKFVVWFEPTQLGEVTCEVTFDSRVAGKYVFTISGVGTAPAPRGPYSVPVGAAAYIHFKNVFDEVKTFQINVEAPEFTVDSNLEQIEAKKEIKVAVHLSSSVRGADPLPSGSLSVECCPPEPPLTWTYFLQGVP